MKEKNIRSLGRVLKVKIQKIIRSKKLARILLEYTIFLECFIVALCFLIPQRIKASVSITDIIATLSSKSTESIINPSNNSLQKYIFLDKYVARISPLTEYSEFIEIVQRTINRKENEEYNIKLYNSSDKIKQVTTGIVTSGMALEIENKDGTIKDYALSVIGDITKNGDCNVTELTRVIKYVIGLNNWDLSEEEKLSVDFNYDNEIDISDIELCINYIVFGQIKTHNIVEIPVPSMEIIGQSCNNEWYNSHVNVKISDNENSNNILKTETTIKRWIPSKDVEAIETEVTNKKELELKEDGIYNISSQTYGKNGNFSDAISKIIKIDKLAPTITLQKIELSEEQSKVKIKATDNIRIFEYSIKKDNEEERVIKVQEENSIDESINITENGIYTIKVKDLAGNISEKTIEISNIKDKYKIEFVDEDGTILDSQDYKQGDSVKIPEVLNKKVNEAYQYQFIGWDKEITKVTGNETYTAIYTKTYINYEIIFKNEDGTQINSRTYHYGDTVELPENPTKQTDETYTYKFSGWDKEVTQVTKNEEYTAAYTQTYIDYTIIFNNFDGRQISSRTYHYGDTVELPQNPTKQSDETYTYEFSRWDKEVTQVTGDTTYIAIYTPKQIEYTVKFINYNGKEISSKIYHYGDAVELPENPTRQADEIYTYKFSGWDKEITQVTKNVEYTATYIQTNIDYTIIFNNYDGTQISSKTYHYGDVVELPENPTRQADETYTYEFNNWDKDITKVEESRTYTATYKHIYKEYTIQFNNYNEEEISSKTYHYGDSVEVPENPGKEENDTYSYQFIGWDKEVRQVTQNTIYTAVYKEICREYIITFNDYNGIQLTNKTYHYGEEVEVPKSPTRQADEIYTYEFSGWDKEITAVTGNTVYTATYESTHREYGVIFNNYDGTQLTKKIYHYGDEVEVPGNPTRQADNEYEYEFIGWDKDIVTVNGDAIYTAVYTNSYIEYIVEFKDYDGEIISSKIYHYGDIAKIPENPTKQADETYTYEFSKWDKEVTQVTEDREYTAIYTPKYIEYTIVFNNYDGTQISSKTYHYGEEVEVPENPTRQADNIYTYEFNGWDKEVTQVTEDREYTAIYTPKYIEYTIVFNNYDGTQISSKIYYYEDEIELPEEPTKQADNTYTYEFGGWDKEISVVTGNVEYIATYTQTYIDYTIEFNNFDGTQITSKTYHYNDMISIPDNPTRESNETYTYKFTGWNKEISQVTEDTVYTAIYQEILRDYTITFNNYDGVQLSKNTYHYGDTVEAPENPTKEADETYTYEFNGWDKEVITVTGNIEYTATYTPKYIDYTIVFNNYDGIQISQKTYHYGDTVEVPENPTKEADNEYEYEFSGWDKEVINISENAVYTATYNSIKYKVTLENADGTTSKYTSLYKAFNQIESDEFSLILIEDIDESINISQGKKVTINLNNHKINSSESSTIINNGELLIVDDSIEAAGKIENTNITAIINNGTLTIGYDDGTVNENIIVEGLESAIKNNSTFYMYDGTIIGNNTIIGNEAIIPSGEEYGILVKEKNGKQTATIQIIIIPEALVEETYYTTLSEAIAANNNTTITLVKREIKMTSTINIDASKNLTINLNGNTLEITSTNYAIENNGTLNIIDSSENHLGKIINTNGNAIKSNNKLNVNNINISAKSIGIYNTLETIIENTDITTCESNQYSNRAVYNYRNDTNNDVICKIDGGNILGDIYSYNSNKANSTKSGTVFVEILNATIDGSNSRYGIYNSSQNNAKIVETIDSTEITCDTYGIENDGNVDLTLLNSNILSKSYGIYNSLVGDNCYLRLKNSIVKVVNNKSGEIYGIYNSSNLGGIQNTYIEDNTQIICNNYGTAYGIFENDNGQVKDGSNNIELIDGKISSFGGSKGYGVNIGFGELNFLGGSIESTTETIKAPIGNVAEGKTIQTIESENGYISSLVNYVPTKYVASIGEDNFYTLEDAINTCSTPEAKTITILDNFEQHKIVSCENNINAIIDLNGYAINLYGRIENEGNLQITDNSGSKLGIINAQSSTAIINKGNATFSLNGGKIYSNETSNKTKLIIYNKDQANVNIIDGEMEFGPSIRSTSYLIYNISQGQINITGGELKVTNVKSISYGIYNYINVNGGDRNINITGGILKMKDTTTCTYYGIYNIIIKETGSLNDGNVGSINLNIKDFEIDVYAGGTACGIYNSSSHAGDNNDININIENSKITTYCGRNYDTSYFIVSSCGIYNLGYTYYGGKIKTNIKSGEINSFGPDNSCCGICLDYKGSYLELGEENQDISVISPTITGKDYGIYKSASATSANINFYGGKVKGKIAITEGTTLNIEDGKEIYRFIDEEDNYDTIVLQQRMPVATINQTEYMSVQEAVESCIESEEYNTIKLIRDILDSSEEILIASGQKITLDLNGHNLSSVATTSITNNGELNIVDTKKTGKVKNTVNTAIKNNNELQLNDINVYGKSYALQNTKDAQISSCIIESSLYGIQNNAGNINIVNSQITVGSKNSDIFASAYGIFSYGNRNSISVNNSNISALGSNKTDRVKAISISGGTLNIGEKGLTDTTAISSSAIGISNNNSAINYYGGTIKGEVSIVLGKISEIPDNKQIYLNEEEYEMSLIDKENIEVVEIENIKYFSLAEAIAAVSPEKQDFTTIKVINDFDIASTVNILENQKIQIDLNSHKIISYSDYAFLNNGILEITDSSEEKNGQIIGKFYGGVNNKNEFCLSGGEIKTYKYALYNDTYAKSTIKDGLLESTNLTDTNLITTYLNSYSTLKILGGEIKAISNGDYSGYANTEVSAIYAKYKTSIELDGGIITVEHTNGRDYSQGIKDAEEEVKVIMKSGQININSYRDGCGIGSTINGSIRRTKY